MRAKFAALAAVAGVAVAAACAAAWGRQKAADDWVLEPTQTAGAGTSAASPPEVAAIPVEPAAVESATEQDGADDLSAIKGIGPVYVERLDGIGVTTLDQVAGWSDGDIDSVGPRIKADPNRIRREDWVGQARRLVEPERS